MKVLASIGLSALLLSCSLWVTQKSTIRLIPQGVFKTDIFDNSAQEIVAYDPVSQRLFVVNGASSTVDIIDISDTNYLRRIDQIDLRPYGKQANSVAVHRGIVIAAVEDLNKQAAGQAVIFDIDGNFLARVRVGALPDMVTITPDGKYALVANEGEPSDDYMVDPEGSVSVIRLPENIRHLSQDDVRTADFQRFTKGDLAESVKIFGPAATVAQDLEPEYISVSADSQTAWVTMQENNAIAEVNISQARVTEIFGLGYKNHMDGGNPIDASNRDGKISIQQWPVLGLYQPDSIATYEDDGSVYLVTANEGDSRDYSGYSEEVRVKDLMLDPLQFPDAAELQKPENLGRLKTTTALGDWDNDGDFDQIMSYGARSFSIWDEEGELVFDSGADFETITARLFPENFNSTDNENNSFDDRSDDKGPEPEALAIGKVNGETYAFIGLERMGGIMVYRITDPEEAEFVQYINTRDYSGDPVTDSVGDLAPEGFKFIKAKDSPIGKPLLVVAFEVSGSTRIFEIDTVLIDD